MDFERRTKTCGKPGPSQRDVGSHSQKSHEELENQLKIIQAIYKHLKTHKGANGHPILGGQMLDMSYPG